MVLVNERGFAEAGVARKIRKQQEREYRAEMKNRAKLEEQATLFY